MSELSQKAYIDWNDFAATASAEEITAFTHAVRRVAEKTGIIDSGYQVISNIGRHGHQEVPHLHMRIGRRPDWPTSRW